jgi:hypothetical protein
MGGIVAQPWVFKVLRMMKRFQQVFPNFAELHRSCVTHGMRYFAPAGFADAWDAGRSCGRKRRLKQFCWHFFNAFITSKLGSLIATRMLCVLAPQDQEHKFSKPYK